jgi:hypothetical protein
MIDRSHARGMKSSLLPLLPLLYLLTALKVLE